jgi:hypothetical protein
MMNPCCAAFLYAFCERSILADRIFLQDRYFHQLFAGFHSVRDEEDLPCTATFFGRIGNAGICTRPWLATRVYNAEQNPVARLTVADMTPCYARRRNAKAGRRLDGFVRQS